MCLTIKSLFYPAAYPVTLVRSLSLIHLPPTFLRNIRYNTTFRVIEQVISSARILRSCPLPSYPYGSHFLTPFRSLLKHHLLNKASFQLCSLEITSPTPGPELHYSPSLLVIIFIILHTTLFICSLSFYLTIIQTPSYSTEMCPQNVKII